MQARSIGHLLPAVCVWLIAASASTEPSLVLLVPEDSELRSAPTQRELRRLYLGQQRRLGGHGHTPLDLPVGSAAREAFDRRILRMTADQLASYWIEKALLGGALPPEEVEDRKALVRWLRRREDALGYALVERGPLPALEGIRVLPLAEP